MILSNNSSYIPWAIVRNSDSALDLATTFCFLLRQVTKFLPRKVQ
uniref:Copia protein n=1 Tax=Rhizophora mucronata TaxID=61149 RepID=A0A2P2Q7P2_RHIMU